ncbi:hypothetical protein CBR_g8026 [Chara braunii]|uniref:Uncharacterized protein n=1 Tax=Chara braunii TaxID=69332 RepID=A0A388KL16_CHABU|nr:hypothetical protein CBR_g8026 [Chara braunii]|eukprot:GBG70727.1 hypothetical protein CBR_g8026 [Chara braunii]
MLEAAKSRNFFLGRRSGEQLRLKEGCQGVSVFLTSHDDTWRRSSAPAMRMEEMRLWSRAVWLSAEYFRLGGLFKGLSNHASSLIHDQRSGFQRRSAVGSWIRNNICPNIPHYKGSHWHQIARNADTLSVKRSGNGVCTTTFGKWSRREQWSVPICDNHSRWAFCLSPGATAAVHSWSLFAGSGDGLRAPRSVCCASTAEKRSYIDAVGHGGSRSSRGLSGFGFMNFFGEEDCAGRLNRNRSPSDHKPQTCGRGRDQCQTKDGCENHQKLGLEGSALCNGTLAYSANDKAYCSDALQSLPVNRISLSREAQTVRGVCCRHGGLYRSDGGTTTPSHPFAVVNPSLVSVSEHVFQSRHCTSNSHVHSTNNKATTACLNEWGRGIPPMCSPFACSMLAFIRHVSSPCHGLRLHSCSSNELESSRHGLGSAKMASEVHVRLRMRARYCRKRMSVLPFDLSAVICHQPNFGHALLLSFSSSASADTVSPHSSPSALVSRVRSESSARKRLYVPGPSSSHVFCRNSVVLPLQQRGASIGGTGIGGMWTTCLSTSRGNGQYQHVRSFFHLCSGTKDSRNCGGVGISGRRQESVVMYAAGKDIKSVQQLSQFEYCVGRQTRGAAHGRYNSEPLSSKSDQGGLVNRDLSSGHTTDDTLRMNAFAAARQSMSIGDRTDPRVVDGKGAREDAGDGGMDLRDGTCRSQDKDDTLVSGGVKVQDAGKQMSVADRLVQAGWTREEVLNWPNALSMARLLSGPLIAMWVMQGNFSAALIGLAAAGLSDWLDGFIAKRYGSVSVVGSYLDPLADKVLVCCLTTALAVKGYLSPGLVVLIVSRDAALVGGAFLYRAYNLSWKWQGFSEFFNVTSEGAPIVKPLLISKVNTGAQLALVGSALSTAAFGFPDAIVLEKLGYVVIGTTILSWAGYGKVMLEKAGAGGLGSAQSQSKWLAATKSESRKGTLIAAAQMPEADRKHRQKGHRERADVEKQPVQVRSERNDDDNEPTPMPSGNQKS